MRGVKQPTRALSGARDRVRKSGPLGRCQLASNIPVNSRTRQLPGHVRKTELDGRKGSQCLVIDSFMRATK